jgi:hypothetical protein
MTGFCFIIAFLAISGGACIGYATAALMFAAARDTNTPTRIEQETNL